VIDEVARYRGRRRTYAHDMVRVNQQIDDGLACMFAFIGFVVAWVAALTVAVFA
jgi:hypothetical protein